MKITFVNKKELEAFLLLLQEISLSLEAKHMEESNPFERYETEARMELIDEIYPKVYKKQFNNQVKNTINITKALAIIIFQHRDILVDVYTEILKNRIVEHIHKDMI